MYVGSTSRTLKVRASEHRGISSRTGMPLTKPPQSSIRDHCEQCSGDVLFSDFSIISSHSGWLDLRISESLFIHKIKPDLNDMQSAFPLKIVNR